MEANLASISDNFRIGEICNHENFLKKNECKEVLYTSYDMSKSIYQKCKPKSGPRTIWMPDKLK